MPDFRHSDSLALGDALRALPPGRPDAGGWQRLQAQCLADLRLRRQRRLRQRIGWAAAASVLLAIGYRLLPLTPVATDALPAAATLVTADSDDLQRLRDESAQLDQWRRVNAGALVETAESAALAAQINDRIGWIDVALDAASGSEAERALWQERVLLLRRLTRLESRGAWLAATAASGDAAAPLVL